MNPRHGLQGMLCFADGDWSKALLALSGDLHKCDVFYDAIGGLVGYQLKVGVPPGLQPVKRNLLQQALIEPSTASPQVCQIIHESLSQEITEKPCSPADGGSADQENSQAFLQPPVRPPPPLRPLLPPSAPCGCLAISAAAPSGRAVVRLMKRLFRLPSEAHPECIGPERRSVTADWEKNTERDDEFGARTCNSRHFRNQQLPLHCTGSFRTIAIDLCKVHQVAGPESGSLGFLCFVLLLCGFPWDLPPHHPLQVSQMLQTDLHGCLEPRPQHRPDTRHGRSHKGSAGSPGDGRGDTSGRCW